MKKILLILLMGILSLSTFAQDGEKLREEKIKFIKKKLALTADEEKKFLPLYEKYMDEAQELRKTFKSDVDLAEVDLTFMTDEECQKLIDDILNSKQKEVDLIKKYTEEFKKVLPVKKVAMIFKAEVEFKQHLVKKLKEFRKEKRKDKGKNKDKEKE
jgi:hypothetical protein